MLSPNGRAHWREKHDAKQSVENHLLWALHRTIVQPVSPPARVTYRWIFPNRRKRDRDNHGTGVVKVLQDSLVKRGILPGGDHSEALESSVEIVYEKGRRALEIVLEPAEGRRALGAGGE